MIARSPTVDPFIPRSRWSRWWRCDCGARVPIWAQYSSDDWLARHGAYAHGHPYPEWLP